ncbi:MAG: primosomal protein N' [Candidatus Omnitrophota bacterium]
MLYAQIVLGLPVEGPFDYSIPDALVLSTTVGCRVRINFRNKKEIGYIVGLSDRTLIKTVKPVIDVIDRNGPLLSAAFLELAKQVSLYYYCSWGQAIEIGIPMALRLCRKDGAVSPPSAPGNDGAASPPIAVQAAPKRLLIHDHDGDGRIRVYQDRAADYLQKQMSVILLVPDKDAIERMRKAMESRFSSRVCVLVREGAQEIGQWVHVRNTRPVLVIGTRSAVFAPVHNLGCIIIDEEHDYSYKQDQSPHYHAREVSMMRCDIEKADFIAGSAAPSLEMMCAVASGAMELEAIAASRPCPQIKIVDMKHLPLVSTRQKITISGYLQEAIQSCLSVKGKTLLFLNRKGYATLAICSHCAKVFQCPRCNVNLNFHYEAKLLRCHYCNYSMAPPNICPECNAGYVRFLGAGTEKLESELCRIFPQARIRRWESGMALEYDSADIFIATQAAIRHAHRRFDLVGVLGIDNALNHVDFRSSEKAFGIATCLSGLADKQMVVQTNMTNHHVLNALTEHSSDIFYNEEFRQRKQLLFPPYRHFTFIKFRGKDAEKVEKTARAAFDSLSKAVKPAGISVISVNPAQQAKLRSNYHWIILIACKNTARLHDFLKNNLPLSRHSGIIVTVDVDPI